MRDQMYVTTQRTAKRFKLQSVLALTMIFIGVIMALYAGGPDGNTSTVVWGCLLALAGFTWRIINNIRVWWNHD